MSNNYIITGDWHLREDCPPFLSNENWMELQKEKVKFLIDTAIENNAVIIHTGDFFHKPKPSLALVQFVLDDLLYEVDPDYFFVLPGNHDTRTNGNIQGTALGVIESANKVQILGEGKNVCLPDCFYIVHEYISNPDEEKPNWEESSRSCKELIEFIRKDCPVPENKVVLCGDNHQSFSFNGINCDNLILNPGCMTKQRLSEKDYTCSFFLYNIHLGEWQLIEFPKLEEFDIFYEEEVKNKNSKFAEEFIESLLGEYELGLSFTDNLKKFVAENDIEEQVVSVINKCVYGE